MNTDTNEDLLNKLSEKIMSLGDGIPPNIISIFIGHAEQTSAVPLHDAEETTRALIRLVSLSYMLGAYWEGYAVATKHTLPSMSETKH